LGGKRVNHGSDSDGKAAPADEFRQLSTVYRIPGKSDESVVFHGVHACCDR